MGIYSIKPKFQQSLKPVFKLLLKFKVHPTVINILALIVSIISGAALLFAKDYPWFFLAVPLLVLIRISFNALDGMVAREMKLSSAVGEVYNEVIDRLSDLSIFVFMAFAPYANTELTLIAISMIILNSYIGIVGKAAGGTRFYGGFIGKADRMLYLGVLSIVSYFHLDERYWLGFILLIMAGTAFSLVQRFLAVTKELKSK